MPALDGTIAFVQMQNVAMLVANDLNFNVLCAADVALEKYGRVAEGGSRFLACLLQLAPSNRGADSTTRIPRPPPPNAALMISGNPIFSLAIASTSRVGIYWVFGARNHRNAASAPASEPPFCHRALPSSALGPTNVIPAFSQASG